MAVIDIEDPKLIDFLTSTIRLPIPEDGIHKPYVWLTKSKWGVGYKVMAIAPLSKLKKHKSAKYIIWQTRWISKHGILGPDKGFEFCCKTIEAFEAAKLKALLPSTPADVISAPPIKKLKTEEPLQIKIHTTAKHINN